MKNHMTPPTTNTYAAKKQMAALNAPRVNTTAPKAKTTANMMRAAIVLCLGRRSERPPQRPQQYGARRVIESKRSGFASALQWGQWFIERVTPNEKEISC